MIPFGTDEISEEREQFLNSRLSDYPALSNTRLNINQVKNRAVNNLEYMEELRSRDSLDLRSQSQKISFLEAKVVRLSRLERDQIPFEDVVNEAKINYEKLKSIAYSKRITSDFSKIDTLAIFSFKWIDSLTTEESRKTDTDKLQKWLKVKLKLDTLLVE